jgi:hypothetical protein
MTKIDVSYAYDLLREALKVRGEDYVDPNSGGSWGCVNVAVDPETGDLCPSCIVGHALSIAGVPLEFLHRNNGSASSVVHRWRDNEEAKDIEITKGAVIVFRAAQHIQDSGGTWGDAVRNAYAIRWALVDQEIE